MPPVDAVQEFKIQTNSYDAQYGHTGGGIINVSLKSGTNQLHGTVYEFARRKGWDANSFQNNAQGAAEGRALPRSVRLAGGRTDLYPQGLRRPQQELLHVQLRGLSRGDAAAADPRRCPRKSFCDGDFSKNVDGQGRLISIYDPRTGRDVNGVWTPRSVPGQYHPEGPHQPDRQEYPELLPRARTSTRRATITPHQLFLFRRRTRWTRIAFTTW